MSGVTFNYSSDLLALLWPDPVKWLEHSQSAIQAIEELIAKTLILCEELELSRELVKTLELELSSEKQIVEYLQGEIEDFNKELQETHQLLQAESAARQELEQKLMKRCWLIR